MKTYLEITIAANTSQRELLIPAMMSLGCSGFQETETDLICYLDKSKWNENGDLTLKQMTGNAKVSFRDIPEENWNEQWEKSLQPIEIGDNMVIMPSWSLYEKGKGKIVLFIDPKMSFGTGYHETTRLSLKLLEKYILPGSSVLDVGTGTGILAIAAVKLGASSAIGVDNDEWALENGNENIILNEVADQIIISNISVNELEPERFNIITANLTLNTNLELMAKFYELLQFDGILILSGMLLNDQVKIEKKLTDSDFEILDTMSENEWIATAAKKIV